MHGLLHLMHNMLAAHMISSLGLSSHMVLNGIDAFTEQVEQRGVPQDMADLGIIAAFMPFVSLQSHLSQA